VRRSPAAGALAARAEAKQRVETSAGLLIGGVQDPAEKAADDLAAQALRGPEQESDIQRTCAACSGTEEQAESKDGAARRSTAPGPAAPVAGGRAAIPASPAAADAIDSLGPGRALPPSERAFYEPRFGTDFSRVRIHDSVAADRAARAINARAFALGEDIAFSQGEHRPGTAAGDRLMAHELAHVARTDGVIRRAALATADHAGDPSFKKVPAAHKKTVEAALKLIEAQTSARKCRAYFEDKCSAGAADELKKAYDGALVHWLDQEGPTFGSSHTRSVAGDPRSIAYNTTAYEIGRWEIAATLLHEMFHTCILGSIADEERVAETGVEECSFYTPWIVRLSTESAKVGDKVELIGGQLGPQHDADHRLLFGGSDIKPQSWDFSGTSAVVVTFEVPAGATSGDVQVTNHGVKSNKRHLKVTP
jgi:hypothetical protein